MSWSNEFLEALQDRTLTPIFYLQVMRDPSSPGATGEQFFSHFEERLPLNPMIERSSVRVSSGAVSLLSWSKSFGGLTLGIHGGADESTSVLQSVVRGCLVRLFVGFPGWDYGDFQPVFTGQVTGLRGTPMRGYQLQCWDILRALGTRWTTTNGQQPLFYNLDTVGTTVAGSGYDAATPDTTIEVADASSAYRETGGRYVLLVTPTSGDDFYLVASSVSTNVFTLVSPSSNWYGTTRANAASGKTVKFQALLYDHPADIFRKMLISTGTGTAHSTWDSYPADWGFGCPVDWVDLDDIDDAMTRARVDTAIKLDLVVTEEQPDPISWFFDAMSDKGFFPVHRQGMISFRAVTDPFMTSASAPGTVAPTFSITDMEIEQVLDWQAWDGSMQIEYQKFIARDASGSNSVTTGEPITTLPNSGSYIFDAGHAWQSGSDWTDDLTDRLAMWALRVPERCSVLLAGLAYAGLCEGDIGRLTSAVIPSRDPDGTMSRYCMVLSCQPDWLAGTVRLDLAIPPEWSTEFKT